MKYIVGGLLMLILATFSFGQKTFDVQDFSDDYYGKVYLEQPSEVFSKGWVAIYQKKTNRQLIKINSEELVGDTEDGKIKANVHELPYGEQSSIIYEDFNFDGIKDFAIMDGQNSCYHGPSFQIYLGGKLKGQFVLSKSFTRLAQEYCGMFEVNQEEKMISTMTKSGCCWHEYSDYKVINNIPRAVKTVEEDARNFPLLDVSTGTWNGKRMITTSARNLNFDDEELKVLLSFNIKNGEKQVVLYEYQSQLGYALINKNQNVEFAYPQDSPQEESNFQLDSKENPTTLSFSNKKATYKIYQTADGKIGVRVSVGGKMTDIPGDPNSLKGTLNELSARNLENLSF